MNTMIPFLDMNNWIKQSIMLANETDYLDNLFEIYPTIQEGKRKIDTNIWNNIEENFKQKNDLKLFLCLSKLDLFPIKDSYVWYLKQDKSSIDRNKKTINRLCEIIYKLDLQELKEKIEQPKETNRQIGPMFKNWIKKNKKFKVVNLKEFDENDKDAILDSSDSEMMYYAKNKFNYNINKGIDFIARVNKKFVIGETKFLTAGGGHQHAQFNDAVALLKSNTVNCIKVAILDGVLYIEKEKMYKSLTNELKNYNICSALLLDKFLESLKTKKKGDE